MTAELIESPCLGCGQVVLTPTDDRQHIILCGLCAAGYSDHPVTISHGPGDAGRYPCSRCGERVLLAELIDHFEQHVGLSTSDPT